MVKSEHRDAIDWWKLYYLTNNDAKLILNNELTAEGWHKHTLLGWLTGWKMLKFQIDSNEFTLSWYGIKIQFCLASFLAVTHFELVMGMKMVILLGKKRGHLTIQLCSHKINTKQAQNVCCWNKKKLSNILSWCWCMASVSELPLFYFPFSPVFSSHDLCCHWHFQLNHSNKNKIIIDAYILHDIYITTIK